MTVTCAISRHPAPSVTCGPTVQNGPTSTSSASDACGSTTDKGEIFGISRQLARGRLSLKGLRIDQHELDVRLARQLLADERLAPHVPRPALHPHGHGLQDQLVPRHD